MRKIDVEQGSREWHLHRHGKVTGTTLKSALGSKKVQETLMHRIVSERMTEVVIDEINVSSIVRGKEMEPKAAQAVSNASGIAFEETGFLVSDEYEGFGFSPDRIYEEQGIIVGGAELKCPGSKKHVEYMFLGGIPKEYDFQVMAPFLMSDDVRWWYFASFDDRNYERPLYLYKATRDDFPEIPKYRKQLKEFLDYVNEQHMELTF